MIKFIRVIKYKITHDKTVMNTAWILCERTYTMVISFIALAYIARYFGPENFGIYNYALSLTILFTAIATLGLQTLTIKEIVVEHIQVNTIVATSFFLRVLGGGVGFLFANVAIFVLRPNDGQVQLIVLITGLSLIFSAFEVFEYWIQAKQKIYLSSIVKIIVFTFVVLAQLSLVFFGSSIIYLAAIYSAKILLIGIGFFAIFYSLNKSFRFYKISLKYCVYILKKSWFLILSGMMITIYTTFDKVMIGELLDDYSVGIYSAAAQIATLWYFLPMAIIVSFKPKIFEKLKKDRIDFNESIQNLYVIITLIGLAASIFISIFSKTIVNIIYGSDYMAASLVLTISVWGGIFATLGTVRSIWLASLNLQKFTLVYTVTGVLLNILLNFILIPIFGIHGAAITTVFSQLFSNVFSLMIFKKTRESSIMIIKSFCPSVIYKTIKKIYK